MIKPVLFVDIAFIYSNKGPVALVVGTIFIFRNEETKRLFFMF